MKITQELLVLKTDLVKDMDTVNIDFDGSVEGAGFEGGKSENYDLVVGSHTFIPVLRSNYWVKHR